MNPSKLNRVLLILCVVGVFIATVLSLQHLLQREIPCGADGGCVRVASHRSSYFYGLPVAYYGLAGYLTLSALAVLRSATGKILDSRLVGAGFGMAAFGLLVSWYLQYVSIKEIGATCRWCVSSAILMTVIFAIYVKYYSLVGTKIESGVSEGMGRRDIVLGAVGLAIATTLGGGVVVRSNKISIVSEVLDAAASAELVPAKGNILGPATAKVTLVEFADLCCPTCRRSFPKLMELRSKYGDNIRVVYRHFPIYHLPGHEMTSIASITAEVAADQGKFWQFATAFVSPEEAPKTPEGVYQIAAGVGIDRKDIEKALDDEKSPANERFFRDYNAALGVFKIGGTPTYFLMYNGVTKKLNGEGLAEELRSKEVQDLLTSK